jgi:alpha-tubulin suppressor-like RCC1 family protein
MLRELACVVILALTACQKAPEPPEAPVTPPPVVVEKPPPEPEFVDLDLQTGFGCALRRDGTVHCWGRDPALLLGLRAKTHTWTEGTQVEDIPKVTDIASTFLWTCAVVEDGSVMCWGQDNRQVHDRITIAVTDTVELSAEGDTCARDKAGDVRCWGFDRPDELHHAFDQAIDIDVGSLMDCALDSKGGVWCWRRGGAFVKEAEQRLLASKIAEVPGAVEIEVGVYDFCVRREDGEVWCAERINPKGLTELTPVTGLGKAVALARASKHGCAVLDDQRAACFGGNGWAQLGDGTSTAREQPVAVPGLSTVSRVEASQSSSCAIDLDGIACWGTTRTEPFDLPPTELNQPLVDVVGFATDQRFTCASDRSGALWCWGVTFVGDLSSDPYGIFGASKPTRLDIPGFGTLRKLQDQCLLDDRGELRCGHLGDAQARQYTVGDGVFTIDRQFSGVDDFARGNAECILAKGKLDCQSPWSGSKVTGLPKLRKPTAVAADFFTYYVIHDKGKVLEFSIEGRDEAMRVASSARLGELTGVRSLFGIGHSRGCAIDDQNAVWCWDRGARGVDLEPYELTELGTAEQGVRFGFGRRVCARRQDGRVACIDERTREWEWLTVEDVVDMVAGEQHMCVRQGNGAVTCMGPNQHGELGSVPTSLLAQPTRISL